MSYPVPVTRIKTDARPTAPAPVKAGSLILAGSNVKAVQHLVNFMKGKENGTAFMQAHPWFAMGIRVFTYAACIFTGIVPMFLAAYLIDRIDNRQAASKNNELNQKMNNVFGCINRKKGFFPLNQFNELLKKAPRTCFEVIERNEFPAKHAAAKSSLKDLALNIGQKIGNPALETSIAKSEDAINLFEAKAKTSNIQDVSINYAVEELRFRLFKRILKLVGEDYAESIDADEVLNDIVEKLHKHALDKNIKISPEAIENAILYYAQTSEGIVHLQAERDSLKASILDLKNNAEHPDIGEKEEKLARALGKMKSELGSCSALSAAGTTGYKLYMRMSECQRLEKNILEMNKEKETLIAQLISTAETHAGDWHCIDFRNLATNLYAFETVLSNLEQKKPETQRLNQLLTLIKQIEEENKKLTKAQENQAQILAEFHASNKAIMEAQNKLDKFRAIGHKALRQKRIASLQTKLNKVELLLGAKSLKAFERGLSSSESSSESDSNSDHESISELNFNVKIQNEEEALPLVVSTLILNEKDAKSALRGTLKGFILNNIKGTSTPSSGTRVEELDSDEESLYESFFSDEEILDESKKVISNDDQLEDELLTKLAGLKVT